MGKTMWKTTKSLNGVKILTGDIHMSDDDGENLRCILRRRDHRARKRRARLVLNPVAPGPVPPLVVDNPEILKRRNTLTRANVGLTSREGGVSTRL